MKMRHNALGLSMLAAVAIAPVAEAQPTTSPVWAVHRAIKVKPGKATEFTEFYRTTIRRFHQARKDAGAQTGWSLTRLVVPSGEEAPYDYVSTTLHTRFPELDQSPADLAPFIEKAGTTPEKFVATLNEVSTLVRRTVSTGIDAVGMIEPGDYVRIDYMKVPPGKAGDYVNLERTIYKPLHEQRMKDGIISAWVLSAATLPGGSERPYEFFTLNAVKKAEQIPRISGGYGPEPFAKVHPNANYVANVMKTQELRSIVRSYLMRVVDAVR
jgi:hypothetical protein